MLLISSVSSMKVTDLSALPFIQRALMRPQDPRAVLSFFFGSNYYGDEIEAVKDGSCLKTMSELWYGGGPEYDKLCGTFQDTVRRVGGKEVDEEWTTTIDGVVAQMICCDQLSRNIFRGTPEAFAYEETALEAANELTDNLLGAKALVGPFYPPYLSFMVVAFMHSEAQSNHERAMRILQHAKDEYPNLIDDWNFQEKFEQDHKDVIDRFGRYPHRNKLYGRENTPDEDAWLRDTENLPGWAKSQ